MSSKFDSYGVLNNSQNIDIPIGSAVEYIDTKISKQKSRKVKLTGIWNGNYVAFNDKDKTIVRNTKWLTLTDNFKQIK